MPCVEASIIFAMGVQERKKQVNTEVDRVLVLGATKQREVEESGEYCVVMIDPEGNEFCVQCFFLSGDDVRALLGSAGQEVK